MNNSICVGESIGNSMKPIINQGDTLYVQKTQKKDFKIGDIIVYFLKKKLIAHRLINKKREKVIAKGDNNPFFDPPINYNKILGKVVMVDGANGRLNLKSVRAKIIQNYFLFFTLVTYYPPRLLGKLLSFLFKERGILMQFLKENA